MTPSRPPAEQRRSAGSAGSAGVQPAGVRAAGLCWHPLGRSAPVLAGVDLQIAPGERVLLAGASGSGKSTLLRAIAGILGAAEPGELTGTVAVDGAPTVGGDGRVGLLVQDPSDARVAGRIGRDVAFGPENLAVPRAQIHDRIAWALEAVGLRYGVQHRSDALSGGEAQRLALAGVLAMRPGVVLLDEPTSMLDAASAAAVIEAVRAVVASCGATLVVVEHQLEGWVDVVDRLVVLGSDEHHGAHGGGAATVVADGPVAAVLAQCGPELARRGVWVPGQPDPEPWAIPESLVEPLVELPRGQLLVTAEAVSLRRRERRGLSVVRRDLAVITALDGVDAQVRSGRWDALTGPSGSGKSTLLEVMCGLTPPTTGTVSADPALARGARGEPWRWSGAELATRVGWVPQRAELTVVGRTVAESMLATTRALGQDERSSQRRAKGLLEVVGLGALAGRNPHQLSGGELRRLAMATALVHGPALMACDEPTVGQDRDTWSAVAGLIGGYARAGGGQLVATHDARLTAHADGVIALAAGRRVS